MNLKHIFSSYMNALRTTLHFFLFGAVLAILMFPIRISGKLLGDAPDFLILLTTVLAILVYLPFAVLWSSRITGVRPRTESEAEQQHSDIVNTKNAQLRQENSRSISDY